MAARAGSGGISSSRVAFPDGATVVLNADGTIFADGRGTPVDGFEPPARGYQPGTDALVVEHGDGDWVLVPPWRCALSPTGFLPPEGLKEMLATCRSWHENVVGGELAVWRLAAGETKLTRTKPEEEP